EAEIVGLDLLPVRQRRLIDVEHEREFGPRYRATNDVGDRRVEDTIDLAIVRTRTLIVGQLILEPIDTPTLAGLRRGNGRRLNTQGTHSWRTPTHRQRHYEHRHGHEHRPSHMACQIR